MSSVTIARSNAKSISIGRKLNAVTGVRLVIGQDDDGNDIAFIAGNDAGYVLEVSNPMGSQMMADMILAQLSLRNFQYQAFDASALVDPAAELGDTVTVDGNPSVIYSLDTVHTALMPSAASAPFEEEVNHEYKFETKQEREYKRQIGEVRATLSIQADEIAAKVSATGGDNQSFGWSMTTAGMFWYANGSEIMRATKNGLKVTGEIVATSGNIGGATIVNGVLTVENANIGSINGSKIIDSTMNGSKIIDSTMNGSKIVDYSIGQYKYGTGSIYGGSGGAIAGSTVSEGNVTFPGTLTQVGINTADIAGLKRGNFGALACTSLVIDDWQIVIESGGRVYAVQA